MRRQSAMLGLCFLGAMLSCCWALDVPSSLHAEQVMARVALPLEQALRARGLQYGAPIFLRIFKASKELELWVQARTQFRLFRIYTICAASGQLGPKEQEGDLQSPEGFYVVTPEQMNPDSQYHLAFNLGYPNAYDQAYGRTGSALMVHGNCVSAGCYAMLDTDIEEIYTLADAALRHGQPAFAVHIFPFRMSQKHLRHVRHSRWWPFWLNLKEGYDHFIKTRRPPLVSIHEQRYVFTQP
jgi:murein L,D-transpeptidase YafK